MRQIQREPSEKKLFFSFLVAAFLPYLLYGFRYFPILDDYIQYWGYPAHGDTSHVLLTIGTLSTRPLASILDVTLWGRFWKALWIPLLLITLLHVFSAFFLYKCAKNYAYFLSPFFFLIYLLFPLGMEGRYWISASSRIVCGLFFASLSLWLLSQYLCKKQSGKSFFSFAFCQLLSCGFYESVAVFSVSAAVLLFLLSYATEKKKAFWLVPLTSVVNIGLMFSYYKIFSGLGFLGSRAVGFKLSLLPKNLLEVFRQLGEVFSYLYESIILGSRQGICLLWEKGLWGIFILLLILCLSLVLCRFARQLEQRNKKENLCFFVLGFILFLAPLVPNALTEDVWITNRSIFPSLIGLALMIEPAATLLKNTRIKQACLLVLAFCFLTASVNEYDTYRRVYEQDQELLSRVVSQLDEEALSGNRAVCVLLEEEVTVPQNAYYKDHIKSVFDSDWALLGALREKTKTLQIQYIQPLLPGQLPSYENSQMIEID
ncbi:MAG: glucosyltransferase domain-containing protein [Clostridia bacterium]|nr:glucosyltransferase domain-containing protein [Clostridia bacterium]